MKLEIQGGFITIDNNSIEATKILEGYGWYHDGEKIIIKETKDNPDFKTILSTLKTGTASSEQVQKILFFLLKKELGRHL